MKITTLWRNSLPNILIKSEHVIIYIYIIYFFTAALRIPMAAPTKAPSGVGGGGGTVGVLTITWEVRDNI